MNTEQSDDGSSAASKSPPMVILLEEPDEETAALQRKTKGKRLSGNEHLRPHVIGWCKIGGMVKPEESMRPAKYPKLDTYLAVGDNPPLGDDTSKSDDELKNDDNSTEDNHSIDFNKSEKRLILQKIEVELNDLQMKVKEQEVNIKKTENVALKQMYQNILDGLVQEQIEKVGQRLELQEF